MVGRLLMCFWLMIMFSVSVFVGWLGWLMMGKYLFVSSFWLYMMISFGFFVY